MLRLRKLIASSRPLLRPHTSIYPHSGSQHSIQQRRFTSQFASTLPQRTWSQKVWYKQDGSPRSVKKGLINATLVTGAGLILYTFAELLAESDATAAALLFLVHIQRLEYEYVDKDLSEWNVCLQYFEGLFRPLLDEASNEGLDDVLRLVMQLDDESRQSFHSQIRAMKTQLHDLLLQSRGQELEIAVRVQEIVEHSLFHISVAITEQNAHLLKNLKDDAENPADDYEIVG